MDINLWEIARYILIPVLGGIIWWLWKLDARQREDMQQNHKRELNQLQTLLKFEKEAEQRFITKDTFTTVVTRIETTVESLRDDINQGLEAVRKELLNGLRNKRSDS